MTNSKDTWDKHFLEDAKWVSRKSKDRSTKCGVVIVSDDHVQLAAGWNGFPRGVNDDIDERHERPAKYQWTEHAERNAIYNAARHGVALLGSTMYLTGMPCCDCARSIVQSGIKRIVMPNKESSNMKLPHHADTFHFDVSAAILMEGKVRVDEICIDNSDK